MSLRAGWTRLANDPWGMWRHVSGWLVCRIGHPQALWPFYLVSLLGERVVGPNDHGFRSLADAKRAILKRLEPEPEPTETPIR